VAGAIAALGAEYVIGLRATNCLSGEMLADEQVTARSKEEVISALGTAATDLRRKLGESISTVKQFDVPLREATTGSLEALKEFTVGGRVENVDGTVAAIPHYQKAIALDPLFARAYSSLATMYFDAGESSLAAKYAAKAYQLRDRGTEFEKVQIDSVYHGFVTGNLEKTAEAYQMWEDLHPENSGAHSNLGYVYSQMGLNDKALAESLAAIQLGQTGENYANVISTYVAVGKLKEAKATFAEAESHNVSLPTNHTSLYLIAFLERDSNAMDREAAWAQGKQGIEDALLYSQSCTNAYFGELNKSRELSRQASDSAIRAGQKETAAGYRAAAAITEALFGNADEAERWLRTALEPSSGQDVQAAAALAYAFAGGQSRAQSLANSLAKKYPQNTIVQFNYLPAIRAQIALNAGDTAQALDILKPARPYELGQPAQALLLNLYPVFVRGYAYLAARDGRAASAEFQEIVDHPGMSLNEPVAALARLGLARASVLSGENEKARSAYQAFLTMWKDSDPNIAVLRQAKAEYANVQQ
jgi:tetratricopeptide (TPR) repeat protein